jgi:hypothetical protein
MTTDDVLNEYTDKHLNEQATRQDYYGVRCRLLLMLPAKKRQAAWVRTRAIVVPPPIIRSNGDKEEVYYSQDAFNSVLASVVEEMKK